MGVSGSGKSTIAAELHRVLGWPFQEGDEIRPAFCLDYWPIVFPLGMYTAATWALSRQNGLGISRSDT
jgi:gluconokinase